MEWKPDKTNLENIAAKVLGTKTIEEAKCCNNPQVHFYAWRHDKKGGRRNSAWVWCSNCGSYAHIDGVLLHDDWEDDPKIDRSRLTAIPKYQEEQKDIIDKHFAEFMAILRRL